MVLESLLNHNYTESLQNIFINAQTQMLLLYSLDCMLGEKEIDVKDGGEFAIILAPFVINARGGEIM